MRVLIQCECFCKNSSRALTNESTIIYRVLKFSLAAVLKKAYQTITRQVAA